jgi:ribosomal protein S18 acetylase RimI-like enzyme
MSYIIRTAASTEIEAADNIAAEAFGEYRAEYRTWFDALVATKPMTGIAQGAELLVAVAPDASIVGAVGYIAPGLPRRDFFPPEWAILRMLSVPRANRGQGLGRALVQAVIDRARRDRARTLGLYSSPVVMTVAVGLYERMGFVHQRELPPEHGVPDDLYALDLTTTR